MEAAQRAGLAAALVLLMAVSSSRATESSVDFVDAAQVWSWGYDGSGVIVGLVDDAVDMSHPALPNVSNFDFSGAGLSPNSHATRTAGVICSTDAVHPGVAPGAMVYAGKALTRDDTVEAFCGLYDLGARVFNMSFTFNDMPNDGFNQMSLFADWFVREKDVLVVKSAGNNYDISAPGDAFNVVTVGRTTADFTQVYPTSGSGPLSDGRSKPDLVAPGTDITTTNPGGGFVSASGTSYSAPHVTGAAALLLDIADTEGLSTNHNVLKSVLMTAARKDVLDKNGDAWSAALGVLDEDSGAGQLDVAEAAAVFGSGGAGPGAVGLAGWAEESVSGLALDDVFSLSAGQTIAAGSEIAVTLCWDRTVQWLDDGDGIVEYTDTFLPEALDNLDLFIVDAWTGGIVASSESLVDNVEHVWFTFEQSGRYDIRVCAAGLQNEVLYGLSWSVCAVPEPAMVWLLVGLAFGLAFREKRLT
ncbi:MAG: S8 family peptidase [Verrucomicrobia bacterium]|nr:S8 family peptidase [Verrucomicrobiota bacterium]